MEVFLNMEMEQWMGWDKSSIKIDVNMNLNYCELII